MLLEIAVGGLLGIFLGWLVGLWYSKPADHWARPLAIGGVIGLFLGLRGATGSCQQNHSFLLRNCFRGAWTGAMLTGGITLYHLGSKQTFLLDSMSWLYLLTTAGVYLGAVRDRTFLSRGQALQYLRTFWGFEL